MNSFFKQAIIGALLAFGLIPTLLVLKLGILQKSPHAPLAANLASIYALYGSVSLAVFMVVGLPVLAIFRRRRWHSLMAFSFGGAAVALVGEILLIGGHVVDYPEMWTSLSLAEDIMTLTICGFIAGAVFWLATKQEIFRGT